MRVPDDDLTHRPGFPFTRVMRLRVLLGCVILGLAWSGASSAESPTKPEPKAAAGGAAADPEKDGDRAYLAHDFDGALAAYQRGLKKQPQNARLHYRVGQTQIAKGDLKEAEAAYLAAVRFVAADHALKAKLLFVLADLRERQKAYDDAHEGWSKYEALLKEQSGVKGFPQTASERKKRLTEYKQLLTDYAAVKARIDKRLHEADERARKSAQ